MQVFVVALDISKAFDTVSHYKLYCFLRNSGIPTWVITVLINWYSKLSVFVKWKSATSYAFQVTSGVRQGSSLSPVLFILFVNIFIVKMRDLNVGCAINRTFLGCIMYADDLIVLSASVTDLQAMLDCCNQVSRLIA